jgi:hypothetical protein
VEYELPVKATMRRAERWIATKIDAPHMANADQGEQAGATTNLLRLLYEREHKKTEQHVKLPMLELPKFDGTLTGWTPFFDAFEAAVDSRDELTDVQKFVYLKSCLQGDALTLVKGFPLTTEAYEKSFVVLKGVYANKLTTSIGQVRRFNSLKLENNNLEGLRRFYSNIECAVAGMTSLGYSIEGNASVEYILTAILISKLPKVLTDSMLRTVGDRIVTLNGFRAAMTQEMSILFGSGSTDQSPSGSRPLQAERRPSQPPPQAQRPFYGPSPTQRTTSTFAAVAISKPKGKYNSCLFCDSRDHTSSQCTKHTTLKTRRDRCKDLGRCWYCLLAYHPSDPCHQKLACYGCNGKHAVAMCPSKLTKKLSFSKGTKSE